MTPLDGERQLLRAHKGALLLTTHRLRYERQRGGKATIVSMLLEDVDSCSMVRVTHPLLLACAVGCFTVGLLYYAFTRGEAQGLNEFLVGILVAGVFLMAHLLLRTHIVEIASSSSRIQLDMEGWSHSEVVSLFDQIEAAKVARLAGSVLATPDEA